MATKVIRPMMGGYACYVSCPGCSTNGSFDYIRGALEVDEGTQKYFFTCTKGHRTPIAPIHNKFEVLFEIGAYAIEDGYYREAIGSFAAALERFYEFSLRVICRDTGISDEGFFEAWKTVAKQSERQLGAFVYTFLSRFKQMPEILPQNMAERRNNVIHRGHIPSRALAIEFGNLVGRIITSNGNVIFKTCPKALSEVSAEEIRGQVHRPSTSNNAGLMRFLLDTISWEQFQPLESVLRT